MSESDYEPWLKTGKTSTMLLQDCYDLACARAEDGKRLLYWCFHLRDAKMFLECLTRDFPDKQFKFIQDKTQVYSGPYFIHQVISE